jgi:hypothetical protein
MPNFLLSCASEACNRCIAALTTCVPSRQICNSNRLPGNSTWRSHDELVPYGFLPFLRWDRTIKPWHQTPRPANAGPCQPGQVRCRSYETRWERSATPLKGRVGPYRTGTGTPWRKAGRLFDRVACQVTDIDLVGHFIAIVENEEDIIFALVAVIHDVDRRRGARFKDIGAEDVIAPVAGIGR